MKMVSITAMILAVALGVIAITADKPDQWRYSGDDIAAAVHYAMSTGEYRSVKIEASDGAYLITCE